MIILYTVLIILVLFITLCLLPVRFVFLINSDGTTIDLGYMFFKIRLHPTSKPKHKEESNQKIPEGKKNKDSKKQFRILKELFGEIIKTTKKLLHYILCHAITIDELNISARVGSGDPADTGIVCGSAYAVIFQVLGFMKQNMKLKSFNVDISPDFDNLAISGGLYTVLRTRIAHAFVILYVILQLAIKYKLVSRRINK